MAVTPVVTAATAITGSCVFRVVRGIFQEAASADEIRRPVPIYATAGPAAFLASDPRVF
jgi:hypothetical protein